jgi:hypothetical protein
MASRLQCVAGTSAVAGRSLSLVNSNPAPDPTKSDDAVPLHSCSGDHKGRAYDPRGFRCADLTLHGVTAHRVTLHRLKSG